MSADLYVNFAKWQFAFLPLLHQDRLSFVKIQSGITRLLYVRGNLARKRGQKWGLPMPLK